MKLGSAGLRKVKRKSDTLEGIHWMEWWMKLAGVLDVKVPMWASMAGAPAAVDEAGALKAKCASSLQEKGKLLQGPKGGVICV